MSAEDFEYLLEELEENNVYEDAIEQMMDELVDEVTLGLCFEVHRSVKKGTFFLDDNEKEKEDQFKIVIERGLDIFGQVPIKAKQVECVCPNCSRNLAASRFAPHLEKCMGMGRTSSRVASRRIARVGKKESDEDTDKEDEDDDWTFVPEKRTKKIKKDRHGHKNSPKGRIKHKNGDVSSISSTSSDVTPTYESLSITERKDLLKSTCGVISEHTKKMCTRSLRCPQHTDDQRKAVRLFLLRSPPGLGSSVLDDEATIDIDTYDVSESKTLRDSLTWEASSNQPSPADSTSTTNSGSSFRKKAKTSRKRKSKTSSTAGKSSSSTENRSNTNTPTKLYDFE